MASFFISLLQFFSITVSSPLISLSSGAFRGLTVNGTDRWLGIPYAQPPVGALRFKTPLSISRPAEGVQDAFHYSHACPQPPTTAPISEDCLYLNVRHVILDHYFILHSSSSARQYPGVATTTDFVCKASCLCLDTCTNGLNQTICDRLTFLEGGAYNIGCDRVFNESMPAWGTFLISVWLEPHLTLHWMEFVGWNFLYA